MHIRLSAKVLILILASVLSLILIPQVRATTTESDYVNYFSATIANWNTHTGTTPYLQQAAGNEIGAYTDHSVDAYYGFADTSVSSFSTITSIKLKGQVQTNNDMHNVACLLYGSSGGAWSLTANFYGDGTTTWIPNESVDLKATINSLARINECRMNLTKHNVGTGTLTFKQVFLEIIYSTGAEWRSPIVWTLWTYRNWSSPLVWADFFQRAWQNPNVWGCWFYRNWSTAITWNGWFYRNWSTAISWEDYFYRNWSIEISWSDFFYRNWSSPITWLDDLILTIIIVPGWQPPIVWQFKIGVNPNELAQAAVIGLIFIPILLILLAVILRRKR
ncbi:MAG: hypothetical protein MUP17_09495 [candidate division Zixibacteria bacterium]|nr:hypothetical protein [candidate division Zixibacteria bacterium]